MEENKKELEVKELADKDLDKVNGGGNLSLAFFKSAEKVRYICFVGDMIYVKENFFSKTVLCEVIRREPFYDPQYHCYEDLYIVRDPDDKLRRILRDDIVNMAD